MPGLNNTAMTVGANAIKAVALYGQLHTAGAGGAGTSNLTTAGRQAITWGSTTGAGDWGLSTPLNFTGGAANGPVYSITLWSASTAGTTYGEFVLGGDPTFNGLGQYSVTALNLDGSAS